MIEIKTLITEDILYSNTWTFDKTWYNLYITKDKLYISELDTEKNKYAHHVFFNKSFSSLAYNTSNTFSLGDYYFLQVNGDGNHLVLKFTLEQKEMADEVFKEILSL